MLERGDFSEKRDFIRMGVECPSTFEIDGETGTHEGIACDLSASGLKIVTENDIAIGTILNIRILPEKSLITPLHAVVEVVWSRAIADNKYELGASVKEMS